MKKTLSHRLVAPIVVALAFGGLASAQDPIELRREKVVRPPEPESPLEPDIPAPDDVAEPAPDAMRHDSGLVSKLLSPGTGGSRPRINDRVDVHYTGWTTDGVMFDSSRPKDRPREFKVRQVIPGFAEGLMLMVEGEQRRLWIPSELAYGGVEGKPQGTLVFDIELLSIRRGPATPEDLDLPPDDAVRTSSGLVYRVLREGHGGESPRLEDMVVLHFTGWDAEGRMLESTSESVRPINLTVEATLRGFREALLDMVPGERRRLWMNRELAAVDDAPAAAGRVVFDLELLSFARKPQMPTDASAVPVDAETSDWGIAHRVLRPGSGTRHPRRGDSVEIVFSVWTREGRLYESSFDGGAPALIELDDSWPPGMIESLLAMVEGERRRVWVPQELGYGSTREDRPTGTLCIEIELLSIKD